MRNILTICLAMLCGIGAASADTRSAAILSKMASTIKSYKHYQVAFVLHADPSAKSFTGTYTVSGEKYYLAVEGVEVYCDGKLKYEVNSADREVVLDKVNAGDKSILANPTKAFDFPDEAFTHSYSGTTTYSGKKCDMVILLPRQASSPIEQVTLMVDPGSGLPVGIGYRMKDVSDPVSIDITSVKKLDTVTPSLFVFDKTKYKSYEIIDFR